MNSMKSISISRACAVIPAYNEARFIGEVITRLRLTVPIIFVVDDGSTDGTAIVAEQRGATVIGQPKNLGKGDAIKKGLQEGLLRGFSHILLLDADLQHAPEESADFFDVAARSDAALVIGNRFTNLDDMPLLRKLTNQFMSWLVSKMCGQAIPDTQCGFRLIRADAAKIVVSECRSNGFDFESEMLFVTAKFGCTIEASHITTLYGSEQSKIHKFRDTVKFFALVWRYRSLLTSPKAKLTHGSTALPSSQNSREKLAGTHT